MKFTGILKYLFFEKSAKNENQLPKKKSRD